MPIQGEEPGRQVRFGATITAVGHALRISGPAVLAAWVVHALLSSIAPVLSANHIIVPHSPFGPPGWTLSLPVAAALAVVSGLLIRWSLVRTPAALRLDARLAAYVGLMVLSVMVTSLVGYTFGAAGRSGTMAELGARAATAGLVNLVINLVFALLALWPIGALMGDQLSPGIAIARMRPAYFIYLGASLLLAVPAAALLSVRLVARRASPDLTDNLLAAALTALATTIATLVLAQIYSRRVRGCDLGSEPLETVADVFA